MTEDDGHLDSDVLADWAQPVFLALFCLAATAALVSVQERALPRPVLLAVTTPFALIGRWFSTLSAGQRAGDGQDMLLDNAATPSGSVPRSEQHAVKTPVLADTELLHPVTLVILWSVADLLAITAGAPELSSSSPGRFERSKPSPFRRRSTRLSRRCRRRIQLRPSPRRPRRRAGCENCPSLTSDRASSPGWATAGLCLAGSRPHHRRPRPPVGPPGTEACSPELCRALRGN
eukprot:scaffold120305_cov63-Phaeocystis_antarctica.AAC.2